MRNLIQFFQRYSILFLFLILESGSFILILRSTQYQRSTFFSSTNTLVSNLYRISGSVIDFFHLKQVNGELSEENADLQNQIVSLSNELTALKENGTTAFTPAENDLRYISAKIINNSTNKLKNYITINKGQRDGVQVGMGVMSDQGAVGIVKTVSDKFAVVIPILNPEILINCKFLNSNYIGPLVWKGDDYRYANLIDIARHVNVNVGDSLVTSGLTTVFPVGIPVGTVEEYQLEESDSYYTIKVRLAVNFRTLSYVKVIQNKNASEQVALEKTAEIEKK